MKQINTAQRINLAKLVLMVNRWEILNKKLGNVKSFKIETNQIQESDNSIKPSVVPSNSKESFVSERQQWVKELSRLTSELYGPLECSLFPAQEWKCELMYKMTTISLYCFFELISELSSNAIRQVI